MSRLHASMHRTARRALAGLMTTGLLLSASPAFTAPAEATTTVKRYKNCTALRKDFPRGVGLPGARDKVRGKTRPVTNFERNAAVYRANTKSDGDHDGIACENFGPTPKKPAPKKPAPKAPSKQKPAPKQPVPKKSTVKVLLTAAAKEPEVGRPMNVTGSVSGLPAGTVVRFQAATGRTWKTLGSTKTRASGRYSSQVKFAAAGKTVLRATVTAKKTTTASNYSALTVYGWRPLAARNPDTVVGVPGTVGTVTVGETAYPHSWTTLQARADSSSVDWNVGRKCKWIQALVATTDGSSSAVSLVALTATPADPEILQSHQLATREVDNFYAPIRGMETVGFWVFNTSSEAGDWTRTDVITPEVLCWG